MSSLQKPILIIGAGISGLTCARILNQHRIPNILFEASSESKKQGYGITLRSWAYSHLLEKLHVTPSVFQAVTSTDAPVGGHGFLSSNLFDVYTGNFLTRAPPARSGLQNEQDFFRVNRHRLRDFLAENVDVRYEHQFASFESKGNTVIAKFTNGQIIEGNLLVGADGVFSAVRKIFYPSIQPTILPAVVINGQQRFDRSTFDTILAPYMNASNILFGVADNRLLAISINDLTATHVDISWIYSRPARTDSKEDLLYKSDPTRDECSKIPEAFFTELKELGSLASPFAQLYNVDSAKSSRLYDWPMRIIRIPREDLNTSVSSNVVLLGDAAHAMPIFAGEGGNHGLLDGIHLADIIAQHISSATTSDGLKNAVNKFYDKVYDRWIDGIETSVKRFGALHMPIEKWRKLSAQK